MNPYIEKPNNAGFDIRMNYAKETYGKKTLQQLIEEAKISNKLDFEYEEYNSHKKDVEINKANKQIEMDRLHKEALKENKKIDKINKKQIKQEERQKIKEEKQVDKIIKSEEKKDLSNKAKEAQELNDKYLKPEEQARKNKEMSLNETFNDPEYFEIYQKTYEENRNKDFNRSTTTPEELNQKIKNANIEYHAGINNESITLREEKALKQNVIDTIVDKKNDENLKEYEKRRSEYIKNNPEQSIELDEKRYRTRLTHEASNTAENVAEQIAKESVEESAEEVAKNLKKSTMRNLGHVMNLGFAVSDFKDAREAGKSTGASLVHAGAEFAKGELLGG